MTTRHTISRADTLYSGKAYYPPFDPKPGLPLTPLYFHDFGAPAAADADGVCASQSVGAGASATINGALASDGVATFDVPRNVVGSWTGTAVVTVTGTDVYGETIVESSASGTSFTGKKAFGTVTSVSFSAAVTSATVGSGDVLGLPFRVDANGLLAARGANAADTGTFVPADTNTATATTGDVRGTYDPSTTLNGSNKVAVLLKIADVTSKEGAFGVDQYSG